VPTSFFSPPKIASRGKLERFSVGCSGSRQTSGEAPTALRKSGDFRYGSPYTDLKSALTTRWQDDRLHPDRDRSLPCFQVLADFFDGIGSPVTNPLVP